MLFPYPTDCAFKSFAFYAVSFRSVYCSTDYAFRDNLPPNFFIPRFIAFFAAPHPLCQSNLRVFPKFTKRNILCEFLLMQFVYFGLLHAYGGLMTPSDADGKLPLDPNTPRRNPFLYILLPRISCCIALNLLHMSAYVFLINFSSIFTVSARHYHAFCMLLALPKK